MEKIIKIFLIALMFIAFAIAQPYAEDVPSWIKQWQDWAQATGNKDFIDWSRKLASPEAIKAGKDWEEFLGYNAVDIVAKDTRAPNIKPGLVITPDNVDQYEKELRELMPFGLDWTVDRMKGEKVAGYNAPVALVVVPTHHCYQDVAYLEATKKYSNQCKLDEKGNLQGWVAGIPFPKPDPQKPVQMVHNYDRLTIMGDNLNSMPLEFGLFGKNGTRERVEKVELHWQNYVGRVICDPKPVIPGFEDIYEKGSIVALYPYDLKGFAAVRTRYKDDKIEDSFITYIPSMRRIRRLAGSNTQDPLVGSDLTWEDWKLFWSKISIHPAKYELLGETIILSTSWNPKPTEFGGKWGGWYHKYWVERRPVWVVRITYEEPTYIYKRRLFFFDKENFLPRATMYWDQKDRFWKIFDWYLRVNPDTGSTDYWGGTMIDVINKHMSILVHTVTLNMCDLSENLFNLRYLATKAH